MESVASAGEVTDYWVCCDNCGVWRRCERQYGETESFFCDPAQGQQCNIASVPLDLSASEVGSSSHRYLLSRVWDVSLSQVVFVMHNPSTASSDRNDSTMRRCIDFARDNGYGGMQVCNLFAFRSSHPRDLISVDETERVGNPRNDELISQVLKWPQIAAVCLAWGALSNANNALRARCKAVLELLTRECTGPVLCLELTKASQPKHPLYIRKGTKMRAFPATESPSTQPRAASADVEGAPRPLPTPL